MNIKSDRFVSEGSFAVLVPYQKVLGGLDELLCVGFLLFKETRGSTTNDAFAVCKKFARFVIL